MNHDEISAEIKNRQAYLVIKRTTIPFKKPVTAIGRNIDNDIVINNNRVSRHHAEIRYQHGKFMLFDLDSSSGTFVNGARVKESILFDGDLIQLANTAIMFMDDPSTDDSDLDVKTVRLKDKGGE